MNSGWRQQLKQLLMKSGDHMQPDIHCLRIAINCDFQQTISFPSRMNTFEHGKSSEMFHIFLYARCSLQWRNCLVIAYVYADLLSNELILSCYPSSPTDSLSLSLSRPLCIYAYIKRNLYTFYPDINYSVFMLCVRITQVKTF